jgi:hypothetical protein
MSNTKNTGGPAYPVKTPMPGDNFETVHQGMTLRDYFAAQVIQGMYSNSNQYNTTYYTEDYKAKMAWSMADAMLKAREQ